jgi:hypothetical protein
MKNIHVLPTDNYSPLVHSTNKYGGYFKSEHYSPMKEMGDSYQNIYITSDEEIRDVRPHKGKWHLEGGNILNKFPNYLTDLSECKLVIMTTDQELIKDGVQAIDDTFLEWFVKNPSCEKVETIYGLFNPIGRQVDPMNLGQNHSQCVWKYKIIIPKEEPKMIGCYFTPRKDTSSATICSNCGQEKFLHTIGEGIKVSTYIVNTKEVPKDINAHTGFDEEGHSLNYQGNILPLKELKQETLEEAVERLFPFTKDDSENRIITIKRLFWIEGAKWQAGRMHSEEELKSAFKIGFNIGYGSPVQELDLKNEHCERWFEQFKKK